jgi:CBS domain-containing protein
MLAHEIMSSPVVTTVPDMPIKDAIRLLDRHDITAMPVIDDRERLVGIISEADLLRGEIVRDPRAHARPLAEDASARPSVIGDVMTVGVLAVHESTDASDIARLMLDTGVKSIPVTRGQRVVGIVSRRDLIRALASDDRRIEKSIDGLLTEAGLEGWHAQVTDGDVTLVGGGSDRDARIAAILARTVPGVAQVRAPSDPERVDLPRHVE